MALPTTATYISYDEFKAHTRVADQKTIADATLLPYILHAEYLIDSYIGYVEAYDSDQVMKFPTVDDDGNEDYPDDMKKACIEITSDLILKGEPTGSSSDDLKSERWSSSGYAKTYKDGNKSETVSCDLPPIALRLLRQWAVGVAPATY